ncbi:recombinase family protein [Erwinia aphidicola]|uniref:recombinase family protein n=1 Tax=Erwinia aphidicola TaxID=68334 RepID=UPI003D1D027A
MACYNPEKIPVHILSRLVCLISSYSKLRVHLLEAYFTLRGIADALNIQGFKTQRGKDWTTASIINLLILQSEKYYRSSKLNKQLI